MLKLISSFFIVAGTTGLGYYFHWEKKQRIVYLKEMRHIMQMMENEINYGRTSFPEICKNISNRISGSFYLFVQKVIEEYEKRDGRSFYRIWAENSKELKSNQYITESDINLFTSFYTERGYDNEVMQRKDMQININAMDQLILKMDKELERNYKMYISIGVMSGLFFCIIFW